MPCMCWYDPPEASKKLLKHLCVSIVEELYRLSRDGDPMGYEIQDIHKLLDHLYTGKCNEKKVEFK